MEASLSQRDDLVNELRTEVVEEMFSQEEALSSYVPGYPITDESSTCSLYAGVRKSS